MPDLRIVQLTGSTTGGIRGHVRSLAAALAGDHRVILAGPADVISDPGAGVRVVPVPITDRPQVSDARNLARIRTVARGADVVHAHGLRAGALAALALSTPALARTGLVVTLHNAPVGSGGVRTIAGGLLRAIAARADAVLGVSSDLVAWAEGHGARLAERALVPAPKTVPGTPLHGPARRALGLTMEHRLVLTVARLAPQKGLGLLADSAALLADRVPEARWLVAGGGPLLDELADQVLGENLPVILLGRRNDVPDLLASADVLVSTSAWEGQPINLQEALAAGVPVVATDVGGTGEVTGDAARLVPYADPDALTTQITAVLRDTDLADELRRAGRRRAGELPTLADALRQTLGIYARVIA
ncbi:glycosyltransferase family 4 protein [Ruania albidiflava]|uniref:glycosyltransferase family 4 protein n=1 Tax=Ruania albidiflava TaxID=366586 RepID=UPI0003B4C900|nr:glycosyltransferase family 4 protein [Ruania albidiflava]